MEGQKKARVKDRGTANDENTRPGMHHTRRSNHKQTCLLFTFLEFQKFLMIA